MLSISYDQGIFGTILAALLFAHFILTQNELMVNDDNNDNDNSSKNDAADGIAAEEAIPPNETLDEMKSRHRKELKAFDGDKRATLKKVKGTAGKGKKAKEALANAEKEFNEKEQKMKKRHEDEILLLSSSTPTTTAETTTTPSQTTTSSSPPPPPPQPQEDKKISKKQRQRQKKRDKERAREEEIARELAAAGPSKRDVELTMIQELYLDPNGLCIKEISADGNCLYRAVGSQIGLSYLDVRGKCADTLVSNPDHFQPFVECDDYQKYIENVRSSNEWGGQIELQALTMALKMPIMVYSKEGVITMGGEYDGDGGGSDGVIRVSFHRDYYALGEHYNSVVEKKGS